MMRSKYIHHLSDWPSFRWLPGQLLDPLAGVRHRQGRLLGRMETLGFDLSQRAVLDTLTEDVVTSSRIEAEILDRTVGFAWVAR